MHIQFKWTNGRQRDSTYTHKTYSATSKTCSSRCPTGCRKLIELTLTQQRKKMRKHPIRLVLRRDTAPLLGWTARVLFHFFAGVVTISAHHEFFIRVAHKISEDKQKTVHQHTPYFLRSYQDLPNTEQLILNSYPAPLFFILPPQAASKSPLLCLSYYLSSYVYVLSLVLFYFHQQKLFFFLF